MKCLHIAIKAKTIIALSLAAITAGCTVHPRSMAVSIGAKSWTSDTVYTFEYANTDTTARFDAEIFVVCKHNFTKRYERLPMKVECIAPDSLTAEYRWVLLTGTALAEQMPTQTEMKQKFIENATLNQRGVYRFNISLDSSTPVKGVWAIGIDLEKREDGKR